MRESKYPPLVSFPVLSGLFEELACHGRFNLQDTKVFEEYFDTAIQSASTDSTSSYFRDEFLPGSSCWINVVTTPPHSLLGGVARCVDCWAQTNEGHPVARHSNNIPSTLLSLEQWVWLSPREQNSRRQKKPIYLCRGVKLHEALSRKNWLRHTPFFEVLSTEVAGTGFVLAETPILNGMYLVAIEISTQSGFTYPMVNDLWAALGQPYLECSVECAGWTILGLVRQQLPTREADGVKIFTAGDYVELCGLNAMGKLKDITDEVLALNAYRSLRAKPFYVGWRETPRNRARLISMLGSVCADCDYATYRNIVWAILGSGWADAEGIARRWCMTAPHQFEEHSFKTICRTFDPHIKKRPTMGTIIHYARQGGWNG